MELSRSIAGKVALITGASSGIGRATAVLFAAEGAKVAAADVEPKALEEAVGEMRAKGGQAQSFVMDVSRDERVREVVEETVRTFGSLDILVNCAGVSMPAEFGEETSWERTLDVNLKGILRTSRAALPHLERSGAGRIVNIASTEGLGATPLLSAYTASKHGVIGLTRGLAVEVARRGITVNAVCPGAIRTGMTAPIPEEHKEKYARRKVPLGRYGYPEEIAHMILSLVLPAASYVTGSVVVVDGGLLVQN